MSGFGEKPFGLSQQRPAGFGAFGSNISDSNRPGGWTLGSGAPSSTGSFDATIRSSYETSGNPATSFGTRSTSSAAAFPPVTTTTSTPGIFATSRGNATNTFGSTGFGVKSFGSSAMETDFGTSMSPKTTQFGSNAPTGFRAPTMSAFGAPSQPFGGWAWGKPVPDTSKQLFSPFVESELGSRQKCSYQNLCFQGPYQNSSQEELRLADYALGHRYGSSFGFGGSSFGTGYGTSMQRSASGPPQIFGMGSQQGAFGTGFGAKPTGATGFGSVPTTTSPFGQAKAGETFVWGQKSQGPNVFGTQPHGFQRPTSSQRDFGVSGSPGFGFARPCYGSAPKESCTSWSGPSIFQAQGQQQAQGSTSFAEAKKPSSSQPPTGSTFRTDLSTAPNPFASAATQVSAISGPSSTSQRSWVTERYATTQPGQLATQLPSTEMPVSRVQVPQSFGQQTQYGQTSSPYYQVPRRPSSDTRLIQQPLQDATRATIQPQLVAKIDEITAYGPPWLFLTTEEKQQQQDQGPLAVRRASKGKLRSQSIPAGFSFRSPIFAPRHVPQGSPKSGFRHGLYPASYPVKKRPLSSDWMRPPDLGDELIRSPSRGGSDHRRTSEDTISTGGHRKGLSTVEKSLSQISKQLKTLEINQDRGRDLFVSSSKRRGQKESIGTTASTDLVDPGREGGAKIKAPGTTTESSEQASSPPSPGNALVISDHGVDVEQNKTMKVRQPIPAGEYWILPSKEDILAMNKDQRKRVTDLIIGRENVGVIRFKHPIDFTGIDLESLLGGLVILESRSATVYPDSFGLKPPPGEGFNVPASISLENSWPRKKTKGKGLSEEEAKRQVANHIERLKSVEGTRFESYNEEDGTWTFSVNHFSTYNQIIYNN
ncbi:nucleoporin autopeptidase-domain-containing protein [Fusarium oxysporum]|nr:nucleoporin autopeptidase-domain-containing protein [Fusarium oxysporum]